MSYQKDRSWSDRFIPEIRSIVGPHLLCESSIDVDTKQAADLVVLKARDMTIAARVRRPGYSERYPYDFTIRSCRDSGTKTEMAKLVEGWGDWMFYGHSASDESSLSRWMLIDLHKWRESLIRHGKRFGWGSLARGNSNGDGTHFIAFDIRNFHGALIASNPVPFGDTIKQPRVATLYAGGWP